MQRLLQGCARGMKRKVDYEQRDGEPEHAVAESFHPVLAEHPGPARGVCLIWHGLTPSRRLGDSGNLVHPRIAPVTQS